VQPAAVRSECIDQAHDLVARGDARVAGRDITFRQMQIGPADATDSHPHPYLVWARFGNGTLDALEWITIDRTRPVHHPGTHIGRHRSKRMAARSMTGQATMETTALDMTGTSGAW
jgi:hypothetical protein